MGVIGLMLHMQYGRVTCVSFYYFLYVVIYAPRLKDFVLSLGGFVVVVVVVLLFFEEKISL